jgi:hypothetical protein
MRATYISGEDKTVVEVSGDIYGYDSAWSAVETHILNGAVITPTRRVQYKIRPSVAVFKELQYAENQPAAISFSGNYREVSQNNSRLDYEIYNFKEEPKKGSATIDSYNAFEQLIAPDAEFLRGHFAEEEIAKLFAMQILDGDPKHFIPNQAVTRSQFVTALAKAVKAPIEENVKTRGKKNAAPEIIFPDVTEERPDYKYINAAYKIGLAYGKSEGYFYADAELTREEAVVLATRVLGIKNLDPAPLTAFSDDADISGWGRREIFSATRLGLIPASGRFGPKDPVTKAEAATLIVRLIDYARYEIQKEYSNL